MLCVARAIPRHETAIRCSAGGGSLAHTPACDCICKRSARVPDAATLAHLAQIDADVLLVCDDALDVDGLPTPGNWRAAMLNIAEGFNLFERMLVAWFGVSVTRTAARQAGYEDGFAPDQPLSEVLAMVARQAVTRDMYRRRGSSPPCYL